MGHVRFVVFYLLCGVAAQAFIVLLSILFLDRSDRFVK